jgi:hypothetical protein
MRPYFFLILLVLILGLAIDHAALDAWRAKAASATATPLVAQVRPAPALACVIGRIPQPAERFAPGVTRLGPNGIALLGLVLDEAPVNRVFVSQVQTVLPLSGEAITPVVRIGPHGFGAPDCSGGPRLLAGEKVLVFLGPSRGLLVPRPGDSNQYGDWQSGQGGTPILFEGDAAYYLSWERYSDSSNGQERRDYVGKSEDVLRLALTYFNATPEERELAFQFVLGTTAGAQIMPPKSGDGGLAWPASPRVSGDQ